MMKRGISFVTSLLMTASLTLVPMEEALMAPSSVVFAADGAPIIKVKDVTVPVGEDSVLVPVTIEGKDVASVTLSVEVNSKDSKEANPEITGVKDGKFAGAQAQDAKKASASNKRNMLWVDDNDTEGKEFKNDQVFLVEVKLPKDAKENSQYTVKISSVSIANSEKKDYKLTDECDFEGTITVGSKVLDGFTTRMDDQKVNAGETVDVPMFIKCSEALGSIVGRFEVSGGAEIVGLSSEGSGFDSNDYTFSEKDKSLFNWTVYEYGGFKISGEKQLVSVQVKIPSNAAEGDVFTLSLKDDFDVALGDRTTVNPENYASAKLTVEADEVKTAATLTIGSKEADMSEATVDLPVYVKTDDKNGIASVVANFKITNSDKKVASIKSIEAGAAIDENDFSVSEKTPEKALWVVNSTTDKLFADDNAQLFILKITLPENREVGDIFTVDFDGKVDVADSTKKTVPAEQKAGSIKIVKSAEETTTAETTTPKETTAVTTATTPKDTTVVTTATTPKDTTVVTTATTPKETTVVTTATTPKETTVVTTATTSKETTVVTTATTPKETTVSDTEETTASSVAETTTSSEQPDQKDEKVVMNIGTVSGCPGDVVELPIKVTAKDLRAIAGDFIFENNYAQIEDVIVEIGSNMSGSKNVNKIVWTYEDSVSESPDFNDEVWMTLKVKINDNIPENVSSISVTFEGSASTYSGVGKIHDSKLEVNSGKINIDKSSVEETTTAASDETTAETTVSDETTATTPKETTVVTTATTPKETTVVTTATTPKETTVVTTATTPKETTVVTTVTTPEETTASENPTTEITSDESDIVVTTSIKWDSKDDANYIKQYPNTIFYFAFEKEFDLSNLSVEVDTVDSNGKTSKMVIPNSELVLSYTYQVKDKDGNATDITVKNCNPSSVYYDTIIDENTNKPVKVFRDTEDAKKFKYTIDVSYQDMKVGSFDVYIGELGDVNLDHEVNPEDGTYVLKISNALSFDFLNWELTHTMEPFMNAKIEKFIKDKNIKQEDGVFDTYLNFAYFLGDVTASNPNNKKEYTTERNLPLTVINDEDEIEMVRYVDPEDGTYILRYYNQCTLNLINGVDEDSETIWNNVLYKK